VFDAFANRLEFLAPSARALFLLSSLPSFSVLLATRSDVLALSDGLL